MTRLERLKKLCDEHHLDPDSTASTGDEDVGLYFLPEDDEDHKPVERYATVTQTGADEASFFIYADNPTLGAAKSAATENVGDSIFREFPALIVDLDTGKFWLPSWDAMPWTKHEVAS